MRSCEHQFQISTSKHQFSYKISTLIKFQDNYCLTL